MIIAVIQPTKLHAVRDALRRIGVHRLTVSDAHGYARQRGQTATFRGVEYQTNLLRKVTLEIVVNEDFLERTLETVRDTARSGIDGNIGDGKVFVLPVTQVINIENGCRGASAV
jgi:nitrogen regulatory protein P-II 1